MIDTHVIMLSIYAAPSHSCVGQGWMKFCITCSCSRRLSATFLITASLARFARNCETIHTVYIPVQQGSLTHSSGQNILSLRSKRFQSSYCAKVRAEAKKRSFPSPSPVIHVFLLLFQLSRRISRGNACYAG